VLVLHERDLKLDKQTVTKTKEVNPQQSLKFALAFCAYNSFFILDYLNLQLRATVH
jgi:hypothetical protein